MKICYLLLHDGVVVRGGRGRGCRPSVAGDRVGVSDGHDPKTR